MISLIKTVATLVVVDYVTKKLQDEELQKKVVKTAVSIADTAKAFVKAKVANDA